MSVVQAMSGCSPVVLDAQSRQLSREAAERLTQVGAVAGAVDAANRIAELVNTRLSFGYHEESGRCYVMVLRSDTGEVLRQIPPERMLEMLAQVRQIVGLILDQKA
ncbi:MAG: flagellar protein FlaG [Firmicutes bacterium]|jgi:flagellar protein FlaG|nr:flagellar protein FlaG [Bacillota bacterium]